MEIEDADAFIERIANAVANKLDERAKINMIAEEVIARLKEMDRAARDAWEVSAGTPSLVDSK